MTDICQTRSQLVSEFQDNVVGLISAQDGRNLIQSALGYVASRDPNANDDSANSGATGSYFDTGSRWTNTSTSTTWFCIVGTPSAAVWISLPNSTIGAPATLTLKNSSTSVSDNVLTLTHLTTGVPQPGFGTSWSYWLQDAGGTPREAVRQTVTWTDASAAHHYPGYTFEVFSATGAANCFEVALDTSDNAAISFLGKLPCITRQSGDIGTALVNFGLMSGTPTISASNLTGTAPASSVPVFVQAGASHSSGAVPDPGSTAHSNQPYLLGDDATFHRPIGTVLGTHWTATDESTASTTATDLATVDSVTFTLDSASTVLVQYSSNVYNSTAGAYACGYIVIDGTALGGFRFDVVSAGASSANTMSINYPASLAAGAHTIKIQYSTAGAGTMHARYRGLSATLAA